MDNQSHNFSEEKPTQTPPRPPKRHSGLKQLALVAVVAALVGGGVGGGVAYGIMSHNPTNSVNEAVSEGKPGTTKVSNVSVNESSASSAAFAKVEKAVVSVVNMQKTQSTSSGLDAFGDLFGDSGSDSGSSGSSGSSSGKLEDASEGSGVIYEKKDGKAISSPTITWSKGRMPWKSFCPMAQKSRLS